VARILLIGAAVVIAFDVAASLLLSRLDVSFVWMFLGEALIYVATGFAAARIGGFPAAAASGAAVAAIDCVIGWPILWSIGTGQVSRLTFTAVVFVLLVMITTGAVAGTAGAIAGRLVGRR
jgi:hypothetical protein